MATEYNLLSIKIAIWWAKFVETQNFSYLIKIHESMIGQDIEIMSRLNYLAVPIDLVIQCLLYQAPIDQNIDQAQKILQDSTAEGNSLQVSAMSSLRTSEGYFHVFEMFRGLLKHRENTENIKKAHISSLILNDVLLSNDQLLIMTVKLVIVYHILNRDYETSSNLFSKLSTYEDSELFIQKFLSIAKKWIDICLKKEERKYIYQNDFQYEGKDIWIKILEDFYQKEMQGDLKRNIAGSKAVVFVEGVTDSLVLKTFKEKISREERVYFFDIEGFSNSPYYAYSKVVKELKIPAYIIFDGDTREKKKGKIVEALNRASIRADHTYTLKQNSIESYLLNSQSIYKAYSKKGLSEKEIKEFLGQAKNKKNKKIVLESLFNHFKLGTYKKKSAEQIAANIELDQIDPEIIQLLKKIMNLENL